MVATQSQFIKPHLKIVNAGTAAVALSTLTMRYWFTIDSTATPLPTMLAACDFAQVGCNNTSESFVAVTPARTGADNYFQIGFAAGAGSLAAGANTGEIQLAAHKSDFSVFTETNDYSFDATKTAYADWTKVTLYQNGTLIWGTEP
jgi:hypothetical protein